MKPFEFLEPGSTAEAIALLRAGGAAPIAGGSDLLAELKEGTVHHQRLVSLAGIGGLGAITPVEGGVLLGAGATLHELEHAQQLEGGWALVREAARGVATPEIRNQATLGGNLCQRPRCFHYRSRWVPCLKKGQEGCPARESPFQHYLSVMGGGACVAAHPSDLAPPLLILEAQVRLEGPEGVRSAELAAFFTPANGETGGETMLGPAELLTGVFLPRPPDGWKGTSAKARERTAGDFALAGLAVGFAVVDGKIRGARVALGGLAPAPFRSRPAELALEGAAPTEQTALLAAEAAFAQAQPLPHNGFKVDLARALFPRAVTGLAG